jgi:hypothetical protein
MDTQVSPTASPGVGTRQLAGQTPCLYEVEASTSSVGGVNTASLVFWSSEMGVQVEDLIAKEHNLRVFLERKRKPRVLAGGKIYKFSDWSRRIEDPSGPKDRDRISPNSNPNPKRRMHQVK